MAAVQEEFGGISVRTLRPYSEVAKGYTSFQPDDVLFAKITPCMENGKVAVVPPLPHGVGFGSTEFHVIRPSMIAQSTWIAHFLSQKSVRRDAQRSMTGSAGQLRVPDTWLNEVKLPIAPPEEQRRIVAKIDELFSELDAGVAALERARANLKRYRASVLKAAVEGRLTASVKQITRVPLGDVIGEISQGWSPKCELQRAPNPDEWAIIKTTAVQPMKFVDIEAKPLPKHFTERPQHQVEVGDILMTRKGPRDRAGVACLVRQTRSRLMVCDTVYRFRPKTDVVSHEYLEIVLNSPMIVAELDRMKSGINDSGVSLTHHKLQSLMIPLLPLPIQSKVGRKVAEILDNMGHFEKLFEDLLLRATRLRQSILKQAFEGKLVPQDPNDESAHVLLERLRETREKTESVDGPARTRGSRKGVRATKTPAKKARP
jgi:type I restriction enzyme S subunit